MANNSVCEDGSFNIEAAIEEFLDDSTRGSLELPRMTTGQRKQVKKAVDLQPELQCESYGFGPERRLHLFKTNWSKTESAGQDEPNEVTNGICGNLNQGERCEMPTPKQELSPINEGCSSQSNLIETPLGAECTGTDKARTILEAASPSTALSNFELPLGLEGFQIRNTFIHIDAEVVDERMVQSMPHGMFSQCVGEEASRKSAAEPISVEGTIPEAGMPVAPSWQAPVYLGCRKVEAQLTPGTHVIVEGLTKLPAFNGLKGIIQSIDDDTGRYSVLLASPTLPSGQQLAKVKGQNLRPYLLPPPPPRYAAPTILVDAPCAEFFIPDTPEAAMPFLTALVSCR